MKLTITRAELNAALTQAGRVVGRRLKIPIIDTVRLQASGSSLVVTATDLDVETRVTATATVEEEGDATAPADLLAVLVAKAKDGPISIETIDDGWRIAVGAGRAKAKFPCLSPLDFPDLSGFDDDEHSRFDLDAGALADALDGTTAFVSVDGTRLMCSGIALQRTQEVGTYEAPHRLCLVATDGHRLSRWLAELPEGAAALPSIILPRKTSDELRKLLREATKSGAARARLTVSSQKVRLEIGRVVMTSKLVDAEFPDHQRVTPRSWASEAIVDRAEMAAAIDRVACVLEEKTRGLAFTFRGGRLTIGGRHPDRGEIEEEIAYSDRGEDTAETDLRISWNAKYIAEALDALPSETVAFRLPDNPGAPTIIVPAVTDPACDRMVILMPLQV